LYTIEISVKLWKTAPGPWVWSYIGWD
jgi:hypothetical protein